MKTSCGVLFCVVLGILSLSGCAGTGNGRQLMSITITPQSATAQNGQAQFVATGHFNTAPMTVSPMPVAWHQSFPAFDPPGTGPLTFTLTPQPFAGQCFQGGQQTITIIAFAPVNGNASGDISVPLSVFTDLALIRNTTQDGGFVAATAQLSCP
jgi:hypothetical protein